MPPHKAQNNSKELVDIIVQGIQEKKGTDIVVMNLKSVSNAISDYFVICSGSSDTQREAIAESIEKLTKESLNEKPWHREGFENKEWILLDYINVVVHIFNKELRAFYGIEELWGDAQTITMISDYDSTINK